MSGRTYALATARLGPEILDELTAAGQARPIAEATGVILEATRKHQWGTLLGFLFQFLLEVAEDTEDLRVAAIVLAIAGAIDRAAAGTN